MKKFLPLFILLFSLSRHLLAQQKDERSIQALADSLIKKLQWDMEVNEKGTLMFLDIPYDGPDSTDYLSLTVAKNKKAKRPEFISIIVPNNIDTANGIFMTFSADVRKNDEWQMELDKEQPIQIHIEKCNSEYCTFRLLNGMAYDGEKKKETDVYNKFLTKDHALFLITYASGKHKTLAVPLFSFKKQYPTLQ